MNNEKFAAEVLKALSPLIVKAQDLGMKVTSVNFSPEADKSILDGFATGCRLECHTDENGNRICQVVCD